MGIFRHIGAMGVAWCLGIGTVQADVILAKPDADLSQDSGWYGESVPTYGSDVGMVLTDAKVEKDLKDLHIVVVNGEITAQKKRKIEGGRLTLLSGTLESDDGWTFKNSKNSTLELNMSGGRIAATRDIKFEGGQISLDGGTIHAGHNLKFKKTDLMMSGGTLQVDHDLEFEDGIYHLNSGLLHIDHKLKVKEGAELTISGSTDLIFSSAGNGKHKSFEMKKGKKGKDSPILNFEDWSGSIQIHNVDEIMKAVNDGLVFIDGEAATEEQFRVFTEGGISTLKVIPEPAIVTFLCLGGGVFTFARRWFAA